MSVRGGRRGDLSLFCYSQFAKYKRLCIKVLNMILGLMSCIDQVSKFLSSFGFVLTLFQFPLNVKLVAA